MLDKVRQTIAQYGLLAPGDRVLVAFSGGPDSTALLHCLTQLRNEYGLRLEAVYINHGLREKAAEEEAFCRAFCKKLGVDFYPEVLDVPARAKKQHESIELAARRGRYEILNRLANELNCDRIAVGHHRDDQVETVLHRIIRGAGIDGLAGMPIKRGKIIRPLLAISRQEILDYLKKQKLKYCLDESNEQNDYTRNYLRNHLLPLLRTEMNPGIDRALWNLSRTAGEDAALLTEIVAREVRKSTNRTPGGKIEVDLRRFRSYAPSLRWRILRFCLSEELGLRPAVDRVVVERCDKLALNGGKAVALPDSVQARLVADKLVLYRPLKGRYEESLEIGGRCRIGRPAYNFRCRRRPADEAAVQYQRRSQRVRLDGNRVKPPLTVRNIGPGDCFGPLGLKGTRTVSDWLTDKKVAALYRDEIPVVCDRKGIIWLVGYEIADRVKVDENTEEVIEIEFTHRRHRPQAKG
ncbi:MAG TPA: tRNA lysidine(34) synthetase TilS [candidate division Zixibacteria bacterium]|nr:tRNA lysidine(34) synthetase TilS [candidate division Zixibacteria bacterium]